MAGVSDSPRIVRFGPCQLDLREGDLYKNGLTVKLQGQPLQVLVFLVKHPGEVVSREILREELWPQGTFIDFDQGLNSAINKIREALGDSADSPRFIETHARRGYRFIAPVTEEIHEKPSARAGPPEETAVSARSGQNHFLIAGVVLVALLVLVGYFLRRQLAPRASPAGGKVMLAVLPFVNLSGDAGQEYLSDGLTEEMITQLGSADPERLGVIARTSAMKYKTTHEDVHQIGGELGVDYVLEGSVRREGNRVRISAQLIQVHDQTHLWAANYERDARDTLALETVVANAIADQVERTLAPPHRSARRTDVHPVNPEAYDLYLKGRFYWNQRTQPGFWKAIESFQQAVEKDPSYAQAYAGLADCYILLGPNDILPASQVYPLAKAAARKALQLDDGFAEAHASLGFVTLLYDWDPAQAEKEFRRAIELDPNYPTAHHWYAYDLVAMERSDEAVAEIRRALELDPLSPIINADVGQILFLARRSDEAIAQCQKTIALDPQFLQAYWYLGLLYDQKGMFDQAFDAFLKAIPGASDSPQGAAIRAAYRDKGINGYWKERTAMLERQSKVHYVSPYTFAVSYAAMGEKEKALEDLRQAYEERYPSMVFVKIEPVFDNLRSDSRYEELLHRIGPR
jgi:TolB-like protein/DNA-binding winged helix-turn-helix (wHTH) protein/Tfp pilus assembly protein PilF